MKDLVHVAIGGCCCLLRIAVALTRAQVGRVPVPPVMFSMSLLVLAMMLLRLVKELGKVCDVNCLCLRRLPFATGKTLRDLLEQPAVPVRILKRCKREVGPTFWI